MNNETRSMYVRMQWFLGCESWITVFDQVVDPRRNMRNAPPPLSNLITDRIGSMGEDNVFTSICLSTGDLPLEGGGVPGRGVCMERGSAWRGLPGRDLLGEGSAWRGGSAWGGAVWWCGSAWWGRSLLPCPTPPLLTPKIRSIGSRYASYWNALLFSFSYATLGPMFRWSPLDVSTMWEGVGHQVNKFEHWTSLQ